MYFEYIEINLCFILSPLALPKGILYFGYISVVFLIHLRRIHMMFLGPFFYYILQKSLHFSGASKLNLSTCLRPWEVALQWPLLEWQSDLLP